MPHRWDPIAPPVSGLVLPVRIGGDGPTPKSARGPRWRKTSPGYYVPAHVSDDLVEQRIIEASARGGVVTGWAALRLHGGGFFDGLDRDGATRLPVPVAACGARLRSRDGLDVVGDRIPPDDITVVNGILCATVERALFDEMRRIGEVREMAVAIGAACAARLTTIQRMRTYTATRRWYRDVCSAARPSSWRSRTAGPRRRTGSASCGSSTPAGADHWSIARSSTWTAASSPPLTCSTPSVASSGSTPAPTTVTSTATSRTSRARPTSATSASSTSRWWAATCTTGSGSFVGWNRRPRAPRVFTGAGESSRHPEVPPAGSSEDSFWCLDGLRVSGAQPRAGGSVQTGRWTLSVRWGPRVRVVTSTTGRSLRRQRVATRDPSRDQVHP